MKGVCLGSVWLSKSKWVTVNLDRAEESSYQFSCLCVKQTHLLIRQIHEMISFFVWQELYHFYQLTVTVLTSWLCHKLIGWWNRRRDWRSKPSHWWLDKTWVVGEKSACLTRAEKASSHRSNVFLQHSTTVLFCWETVLWTGLKCTWGHSDCCVIFLEVTEGFYSIC